jgi:IS5 family transposase
LDEQRTLARLAAFNAPLHRVRSRIDKIFGTCKRSHGLRRMRWIGIAQAQVHLTAIAYTLKRTLTRTAQSA